MSEMPENIHAVLDLGMVGTGRWTSAGTENPFKEQPYIRKDIHGERMRVVIAEREELRARVSGMAEALVWYAAKVEECNRHGPEGNCARSALAHDLGQRAASAMVSIKTPEASKGGTT